VTDDVLASVRSACAWVAARASRVRLAHEAIQAYAKSLPLDQLRAPQLEPATHFFGEPDETLAFVVTLDTINFGSGYFPRLRKRAGMSGYFTVASGLKERFERYGPFSTDELVMLDGRACGEMFGQDLSDAAVAELMHRFARALNDLGTYVAMGFGGSFRRLIESAGGSAARLVATLAEMEFFRDVSRYNGRAVPFYKRAQLTAADLQTAGVARFDDLERLTIFADNLVPHVLRLDGVLEFQPALVERIEREELIDPGSAEEVEIRACAVHAVELIARELAGVNAMQLDYLLWNRGQQPRYKARPRHRARSVYY
jgi:hypothetical protein